MLKACGKVLSRKSLRCIAVPPAMSINHQGGTVPFEIQSWENISANYKDTILLGNGASIAVDPRFEYTSILQHVLDRDMLSNDVQQLFKFFQTCDFELILRLVWQASNVNTALQIPDERTHSAYLSVRESLIQAVRDIHPQYNDISEKLPNIYSFLKNFNTIISLNYDLIVYWAITYGLDIQDQHSFKDCFIHGHFDENWQRFRKSINSHDKSVTLVFYPHGNLILCRTTIGQESKIDAQGIRLLESILNLWEKAQIIPLFVSEGTTCQKVSTIQNSYYLSTIYREVLPSQRDNLTIYGWGFGEHDIHILQKMAHSRIQRVAVSVLRNDKAYCNRSYQIIQKILGPNVHIDFFDCESNDCWNHGLS